MSGGFGDVPLFSAVDGRLGDQAGAQAVPRNRGWIDSGWCPNLGHQPVFVLAASMRWAERWAS
jgi:hypothetical protein